LERKLSAPVSKKEARRTGEGRVPRTSWSWPDKSRVEKPDFNLVFLEEQEFVEVRERERSRDGTRIEGLQAQQISRQGEKSRWTCSEKKTTGVGLNERRTTMLDLSCGNE